jgi:hypothetical protein
MILIFKRIAAMFNLTANEIDFLGTGLKQGNCNYNWYVEFSEVVAQNISNCDTDEFIQYMNDLTPMLENIKTQMGGSIPYQLFCFLHHAPVLIRKQYFDDMIARVTGLPQDRNNKEFMSYYWTPFRVNKNFNGPEADGIYDFREELNYLRSYQSGCRVFIKGILEDAGYATALYTKIVEQMTKKYRECYFLGVGYNFDNLHDGYMSPEEMRSSHRNPDLLDVANMWADEHPIMTQVVSGLALGAAINSVWKPKKY